MADLIKNLDNIIKNGLTLAEDEVKDIFYCILFQIAEYTIYDTNQARASLLQEFTKRFPNYSMDKVLEEPYNHWKNNRRSGGATSNSKFANTKNNFAFLLNIDDRALFLQNNGLLEPSQTMESLYGRNNTEFKPYHVSTTISEIRAGNYSSVACDKGTLNKLIDKLVKKYVDIILKGK